MRQTREPGLREGQGFAQGHTASKRQSWAAGPQIMLFTALHGFFGVTLQQTPSSAFTRPGAASAKPLTSSSGPGLWQGSY